MLHTANELRSLITLLRDAAPDIAWQEAYGPGKWRRVQLLGHLVDSATNNHQRFVRALIEPALHFPAYRQEESVAVQAYDVYGAAPLLELWANLNTLIAHIIERIPPYKLQTPCTIGGDETVPLSFLVEDYNRHLIHHLQQILPDNTL